MIRKLVSDVLGLKFLVFLSGSNDIAQHVISYVYPEEETK
jgi:hypothetical protein